MAKNITRERIIQASFDIIIKDGLDGLYMRHLAKKLDIQVSVLYYYFKNKDELLSSLQDYFLNGLQNPDFQFPPPQKTIEYKVYRPDTWQEGVKNVANYARKVYLERPYLYELFTKYPSRKHSGEQNSEGFIEHIIQHGFTVDNAVYMYSVINTFVRGFVSEEISWSNNHNPQFWTLTPNNIDQEANPLFAKFLSGGGLDRLTAFNFGVDMLIKGFEDLLK